MLCNNGIETKQLKDAITLVLRLFECYEQRDLKQIKGLLRDIHLKIEILHNGKYREKRSWLMTRSGEKDRINLLLSLDQGI